MWNPKTGEEDPSRKTEKRPSHFDEIWHYLKEKELALYIMANSEDLGKYKKAVKLLDKMEILLKNVKDNEGNEEYLNKLYDKILRLEKKEINCQDNEKSL